MGVGGERVPVQSFLVILHEVSVDVLEVWNCDGQLEVVVLEQLFLLDDDDVFLVILVHK